MSYMVADSLIALVARNLNSTREAFQSGDNSTWSVVGTSSTYTVEVTEDGKSIKAVISCLLYTSPSPRD